ncbi:hypothetical protein Cenrod_1115 [Candidatus Symbiobacter mobilis CR]|uniref:SCP domain-containing protein n=1 Tax=Candidatus Symbiobacter mobilis CR TaxID=946483 RepID=U5NAC6_9BURK|nr:hypothetical protein Cenrod_1115 [Candidatus Symbiobacter mobilis CR]
MAETNRIRALVGLPVVARSGILDVAAQAHSTYLQTNLTDAIAHEETPGKPGFTGEWVADRTRAAGYTWQTVAEVIHGGTDSGIDTGRKAVLGLVQAIYHRFGVLNPQVAEVGVGVAGDVGAYANVVINLAATQDNIVTMPAGWVGTYPIDGQSDVTRDFSSDTEVPDPVANKDRVGYPISIHVPVGVVLTVDAFTVRPVGGSELATTLLDAATDAHVPGNAAAIVPLDVLEYGTSYQVHFQGAVDGEEFTKDWTFTTAPYSSMVVDMPYRRVATSDVVRVQVTGGNGDVRYARMGWSAAQGTEPAPSVTMVSAGVFEVRVASAAEVTVTFEDSDGQTVQAVIDFVVPVPETISLQKDWNLVGNTMLESFAVRERFGTPQAPIAGVSDRVISVWKWVASQSKWAFYTPSKTDAELAAFAAPRGYIVLDRIGGGEGFWVKSTASLDLPVRTGVPASVIPTTLVRGWNLLGVSEAMSPAAFQEALVTGAVGGHSLCYSSEECWHVTTPDTTLASFGFRTLWAWVQDEGQEGKWRFFAPSKAAQGGTELADYASKMGYLPFDLEEHLFLRRGEGFWINK